jgi:hypothetical protein
MERFGDTTIPIILLCSQTLVLSNDISSMMLKLLLLIKIHLVAHIVITM